jgi:dihydropteroate synthase
MKLSCRDRTIEITRPLVMGVVNATPDSFSDGGELLGSGAQVARGLALVAQGADVLDIGGQSAITGVPEIAISEEIDRLIPVVAGVRKDSDCIISVDTYRPEVAEVALRAGADIINDISGVLDPALAEVAARHRAGFVLMHTRWRPKTRADARGLYEHTGGVVGDVVTFLQERMAALVDIGLEPVQIILDPGPDFAKTAAQTVGVLRALDEIAALGRPLLLALSRKDFIGVITGRAPKERLSGTLAAIAFTTRIAPASVLRVHDVREVREFLSVIDVLEGRAEIDPDAGLDRTLRWQARVAPEST